MVRNPAGLYGGGAFLVDTKPIFNLLAKKQAQDAAKKTALTKYFTDILDKATPTGMRNNEVDAFNQAKANYQKFSTENADKLANGDTQTVMKAMDLARIPSKIATVSKNLRKTDEDVAKMTKSGGVDLQKNWTDKTMGDWSKHEKSAFAITPEGDVTENPEHQSFDITKIMYNPKTYTQDEMNQMVDKATKNISSIPDINVTTEPHPTNKALEKQVTIKDFDKNKLLGMAESIRGLWKDESVPYTFNKDENHPLYDKNFTGPQPENLALANQLYKKAYGKDIQNDEDLFVATNLYRVAQPTIESKDISSKEYEKSQDYKRQVSMLYLKQDLDKPQVQAAKTPFEETIGEHVTDNGKKIKIDANGYVVDENGNPYSSADGKFDITIPRNNFSGKVIEALPKSKYRDLVEDMKFTVKNGVIQAAQTSDKFGGGLVTRRQLLLNIAKEKKYPNLSEEQLKKMDIQREKTEKKIVPSTPKPKGGIVIKGLKKP